MARRRIPRRTAAFVAACATLTLFAGPLAQAADLSVSYVSSAALEINVNPPADGFIGPGDVIEITPTIRNEAGHPLSGLTGRLILPDDGSILQDATSFPEIDTGGTGRAVKPFQVALVSSRECGRPLQFGMSVQSGSDARELPFSVPTGKPGSVHTFSFTGQPVHVNPSGQAFAYLTVPPIGLAKTVRVRIGHLAAARLDQLTLTLKSPSGDLVPLVVRKGGAATALAGATFSATGSAVPATGSGTISGDFRAEGEMSVLDGASIGGQWQLIVTGTSSAQASDVLDDWSLDIYPAICQSQMIANITSDKSVSSVHTAVQFDASQSVTPADDPILKYEWDLDMDGQYDDAVGETATMTYDVRGAVIVRVKITSAQGSTTGSKLVSVTERPTASLTTSPAGTVIAGNPITLDATGSASDPAGVLDRYEWDLNGDGSYEVDGGQSPMLPTQFVKNGPHTVGVRVTDDARATATATATFTVDDRPPDITLKVPQPAVLNQAGTLDASATTDLDKAPADVLAFSWDVGDGAGLVLGGPTRAVTFTTTGTHSVTVAVSDGQKTSTKTMPVLVTTAPTAALAAPATARPGQVVALDAGASHDADTFIAKYQWDLDGNGSYEADTAGLDHTSAHWDDPGNHDVGVRVTDSDGATASQRATIVVENKLPHAALTVSATSLQTGQAVTFDARASSDEDGAVVAYDWDLDGSGGFETPGGSTGTMVMTYPNALDIHPRVRVTDNEGGQGIAQVLLHVSAPPVVVAPASPLTPVTPASPAPPILPGGSGTGVGSGTGTTGTGTAAKGSAAAGGAGGDAGGAASGGASAPAFAAGLAGATVQRAAAVTKAGVKLSCKADRSVTCALTAVVSAADAKRLRLVTGKSAKPFKVGIRTVRTSGKKASATAFRLPKALARVVAAGKAAVVVVTGTATDAKGRRVALKRSVTLRR